MSQKGWAHGSNRLILQRIQFSCHCLSLRWLKCYKSPTVTLRTDKLHLMGPGVGFVRALSRKWSLHPQQWLLSNTQASPSDPAAPSHWSSRQQVTVCRGSLVFRVALSHVSSGKYYEHGNHRAYGLEVSNATEIRISTLKALIRAVWRSFYSC